MLLISESKVRANLQRMADRCQRHGLDFRPHAKTHQSLEVSRWVKDYGVREISVTSLRMALALEPGGWERITIATPLNPAEIPALNELARRTPLRVFITSEFSAQQLVKQASLRIDCLIELDAGYGRSGVSHSNVERLSEIQGILGPDRHKGYYVHSGHTYDAGSVDQITRIHNELLAAVATVRNYPTTPPDAEFVIGDTPACSTQEDFTGITALGPGNFVYYDLVQAGLGSCQQEDIAACFSAPVLEVQPARKQAIVHAGWVQLGKDQLPDGSYGSVVKIDEKNRSWGNSIPGARVKKLSQEHGTVSLPEDLLKEIRPGMRLGILPVHACAMVHGAIALGDQHTSFA